MPLDFTVDYQSVVGDPVIFYTQNGVNYGANGVDLVSETTETPPTDAEIPAEV